ncbi:hypothetical protein, partial [Xanthomonas graminis]|uniref:hypothetical protein n=1 Tax=Xanthomonas graminis TaxID=3390026 RepID=UPI001C8F21EE
QDALQRRHCVMRHDAVRHDQAVRVEPAGVQAAEPSVLRAQRMPHTTTPAQGRRRGAGSIPAQGAALTW